MTGAPCAIRYEKRDDFAMTRAKRIPSGGGTRRHELTDFGQRFERALATSELPTKRAFLMAADIDPSQFNRYCIVGGTVPNIEQVQRWASLLRCRVAELVPDLAPMSADPEPPPPRANENVERLIVDEGCTAEEAELLRVFGAGPLHVSYFVANAMLHELRIEHQRAPYTPPAPAPSAPVRERSARNRPGIRP
jgi:hypothetical protein